VLANHGHADNVWSDAERMSPNHGRCVHLVRLSALYGFFPLPGGNDEDLREDRDVHVQRTVDDIVVHEEAVPRLNEQNALERAPAVLSRVLVKKTASEVPGVLTAQRDVIVGCNVPLAPSDHMLCFLDGARRIRAA